MTESVQTAKVPLTSSKGADHSPSEEALIQKEVNGAFHLSLWFLGRGEDVKPGSSNPHRHPDAAVHDRTAGHRGSGCCSPRAPASAGSFQPVLQRHTELHPASLR